MLAVLLALGPIPAEAREPVFDALSHLLNEYSGPVDHKAAEAAAGAEAPPGAKLAQVQADLSLMAEGFEAFRHPSHAEQALKTLPDKIVPELRPFFKDRDSSLDALYRTLAVTDYTWAARFPEPPCDPNARRRALLSGKDGLFTDPKTGLLSAWLARLLGPAAYGRGAEEALDRASSKRAVTERDYELLRLKVRKIAEALESEKAVGAARSRLYCARAQAYEDLALAHRSAGEGPVLAASGLGKTPVVERGAASVLLMAIEEGPDQYRSLGAGVLVDTGKGPRVLTDARVFPERGEDKASLRAFARPADGKTLGSPLLFFVEKVDRISGVMVGRLEGGESIPALKLAGAAPVQDDLVRAIGHMSGAGAWTVSQGLVTAAGQGAFASDALLGPDMLGGPLLNEQGEVAGLAVLPAVTASPSAVAAERLRQLLEDGSPVSASSEIEFPESHSRGSASVLTAAMPTFGAGLTAPGAKPVEASQYIYSQTQWGTVRGKCMANCGGGSSSGGSSYGGTSYNSGGAEIGQALAQALVPVVEALIFKGIPALFRGIGSLFSKPKTAPAAAPPGRTAAREPIKIPAPVRAPVKVPEKPKEPAKLTGLTLEAVPSSAAPGETVTLTARVSLSDPEASKAGVIVGFKATPETLVRFDGNPQAKTDQSGVATIVATLRRDHGVRTIQAGDFTAVTGKSVEAQSALDDEVRAMSDDAPEAAESGIEKIAEEKIELEARATLGKSLAATASVVLSDIQTPECKLVAVDAAESVGIEPFTVKLRLSCTSVDGQPDVRLDGHEIVLNMGWQDKASQHTVTLKTDADGYVYSVFQASGSILPLPEPSVGRRGGEQLFNAANEVDVLEPIRKVPAGPAARQITTLGGMSVSLLWTAKIIISPRAKINLAVGAAGLVVTAGWEAYAAQKQYDEALEGLRRDRFDAYIEIAPVPSFPKIGDFKNDCVRGKRIVEPSARYKGGTSIEQEYICKSGIYTRHTIIDPKGKIVHDHFRPGPPKGGGGD